MTGRWYVWHHSCSRDGEGNGTPCSPPCEDPWMAQSPLGAPGSETFPTLAEAHAYADRMARGER